MLGYLENELKDSLEVWKKFIHPDDDARVKAALHRHWQDKTSIYRIEHRMRTRDGSYKWVLSRGRTIWNDADRTVRMAGSMTDITRQKSVEAQLRHIQKMECIGRFAGSIAHDFNNLLALIGAYSQIILEQPRLPDTIGKYGKEILNTTEHASTLTRQLLSLSRRSDIHLRPTDLNAILSRMADMFRRIVGKRIRYRQILAPDLPPVLADKNMLEQLLLNLTINARDAMTSGRLTIETSSRRISADECLQNDEACEGLSVCLRVTDTGSGMDETTLGRIFEPFFTTKPDGSGTGLGLSTVYSVVKQHKGWMTVESEVDVGSTFILFFPAMERETSVPVHTPETTPGGGGETILLVDDEAPLREMAATILSGYNYRVLAAASGPEAVRIWQAHRDEIALLFTDIIMPHGLSGIDIGLRFHREKPQLKIIYTSGYRIDVIPERMRMRETGIFIPKPYIPSELARAIRTTLDT